MIVILYKFKTRAYAVHYVTALGVNVEYRHGNGTLFSPQLDRQARKQKAPKHSFNA